jgi:hypothetical protein
MGESYFAGCVRAVEEGVSSFNAAWEGNRQDADATLGVESWALGVSAVTDRRYSLRSLLRCERRLGGEGFEPPTPSV